MSLQVLSLESLLEQCILSFMRTFISYLLFYMQTNNNNNKNQAFWCQRQKGKVFLPSCDYDFELCKFTSFCPI